MTEFIYDHAGARKIKKAANATIYPNQYYTDFGGGAGNQFKHIFIGSERILTKQVKINAPDQQHWFYHPDHLGSTSMVTNESAQLREHILYFPFGEVWVEENSGAIRQDFFFTAKELDPETKFYDFGARYLDPRFSKWMSADPALGSYLPSTGSPALNLPGMGGAFQPANLSLYSYAHHSPAVLVDPNGLETVFYMPGPIPPADTGYKALDYPIDFVSNPANIVLNPIVGLGASLAPSAPVLDNLAMTAPGMGPGGRAIGFGLEEVSATLKVFARAEAATIANLSRTGRAADAAERVGGKSASLWTRAEVNGTRVYQRSDLIDPRAVDSLGRSNLQRMEQGLAPLGPDGKPINLHHLLQTNDSPIAELSQTFHQKYSRIIHINDNSTPSGIDRRAFDIWRKNYWETRANDFR